MRVSLLALACAFLMLGCIGVSQSDYEKLKSSCEQDKMALLDSVQQQKSAAVEAAGKLAACSSDLREAREKLALREEENSRLKAESAVLSEARAKAGKIELYKAALSAYYDAFGPGKVPNSRRMAAIDSAVAKTGDERLVVLWRGIANCQGVSGCEQAKGAFVSAANQSIASIALEVAEIIRNSGAS
ncbi:MAG: hypothetical protein N3E51_03590 [Candidatus Micrarchaeota archaeon]|nr:hypothetical protein [Candidatus Micrarchaeota archaeon]